MKKKDVYFFLEKIRLKWSIRLKNYRQQKINSDDEKNVE